MKITGKITADDSFEFTLEEHGSTHFVSIMPALMQKETNPRTLLLVVVRELNEACRALTKATQS